MGIAATLYKGLPNKIKSILLSTEGWLVGGAPFDIIDGREPKDYDIIVPNRSLFMSICKQLEVLGQGYGFNSYGGVKFSIDENITLDIWCEELSHFLLNAKNTGYIYNFKRNKLFVNSI